MVAPVGGNAKSWAGVYRSCKPAVLLAPLKNKQVNGQIHQLLGRLQPSVEAHT